MSTEVKKYFASRCLETEAEAIARTLRFRGWNANLYQQVFVIVGPTAKGNPFVPGKTFYDSSSYEDCLEQLLKGENHKVPQVPAYQP